MSVFLREDRTYFHWAAQDWIQHFRCPSPGLIRGEGSLPLAYCRGSPNAPQEAVGLLYCKSTLLAEVQLAVHRTHRSFSIDLLTNQSSLSIYWCLVSFLVSAGFCCSCCWTSQSVFPSFWGSSEGLHNHLAYQSLLPVFCHQQTCWECTLPHHPDNWRNSWTLLAIVWSPGVLH